MPTVEISRTEKLFWEWVRLASPDISDEAHRLLKLLIAELEKEETPNAE